MSKSLYLLSPEFKVLLFRQENNAVVTESHYLELFEENLCDIYQIGYSIIPVYHAIVFQHSKSSS